MSKTAMKKPAAKRKVARKAKPETVVINKPPTETQHGWRWTITLSKRLEPEVERLAKAFKLTPRGFLRAYYLRQLPGQTKPAPLEGGLGAEEITFSCSNAEVMARIERTAAFKELTVPEMVVGNVAQDVDLYEADMILHPKTGEVIGDRTMFANDNFPDIRLELGAHSHELSRKVAERKRGRSEIVSYSHHDPDYEGTLYRAGKNQYEVDDDANGEGQQLDAAGVVAFFIERNIPQEYHGEFAAFLPQNGKTKVRSLNVPLRDSTHDSLNGWAKAWKVKPEHIAQPIVEQYVQDAIIDETLRASLREDSVSIRAGKGKRCY